MKLETQAQETLADWLKSQITLGCYIKAAAFNRGEIYSLKTVISFKPANAADGV